MCVQKSASGSQILVGVCAPQSAPRSTALMKDRQCPSHGWWHGRADLLRRKMSPQEKDFSSGERSVGKPVCEEARRALG